VWMWLALAVPASADVLAIVNQVSQIINCSHPLDSDDNIESIANGGPDDTNHENTH